MTLDREDIEAIAEAVARKLKAQEEISLDNEYLASLPIAEQKRIAREEMKRQDREEKK